MNRFLAVIVILFALPLAAQQPRPPAKPSTPSAPAAPRAPALPAAPVPPFVQMPIMDESVGGQPINVRLDVSIRDNNESAAGAPKTLMVILADRAMGRTRGAFEDRSISIDARPVIVDGRIRVNLTIDSRGPAGPGKPDQTLFWTNVFALMLDNGKPMLAFETLDPVTKRKLSIEVKATLLK